MPKSGIHPVYADDVEVACICGATYKVSSSNKGTIKLEICPKCHPVYTGKKETKVIKGRMEKFIERQKKIDSLKQAT